MTIFVGGLIVVAVGLAIAVLLAIARDVRRLRVGAEFRTSRGHAGGGGFLAGYTVEEIESLQAPRLRWISRSLPDPRDHSISEFHAQYYWRIAVRRAESSQMIAELGITVLSALLGVLLGVLVTGLINRGFQVADGDYYLLGAVGVTVLGLAVSVSTKVAAGRRWGEAIELYARYGWPERVAEPQGVMLILRWVGARLRRFRR